MKNVVLKGLDVCICSTKKMKSKADKVYITFKCHFQMLSIKGISIFKIDAISIKRCFALNLNVNSLIKHVTYFLFRFVHKNWVRRFETRKTEKRGNSNVSILYILLYRHWQNLQSSFLSYLSFIVILKIALVKLYTQLIDILSLT